MWLLSICLPLSFSIPSWWPVPSTDCLCLLGVNKTSDDKGAKKNSINSTVMLYICRLIFDFHGTFTQKKCSLCGRGNDRVVSIFQMEKRNQINLPRVTELMRG